MPTRGQTSLCLIEEMSVREFLESQKVSRNKIKKFKLKKFIFRFGKKGDLSSY